MNISIIIPVKNGGEDFKLCIDGLKSLSPQPFEIIIVLDGCTDSSADYANISGFKIIELKENVGPARARNIGAQTSSGDILFFTDADVVVPPDIINQLTQIFSKDLTISAVIGSYNDAPLKQNFISQYKNLFHHYTHQRGRPQAETFWTGCGAVKREIFFDSGCFNEGYKFSSIEDIELGYRLRSMGYCIRLEKTLMVTHLKEWRALSLIKSDIVDRAIPWTELSLRYSKVINDLNLSKSNQTNVALVYLMILFAIFDFAKARYIMSLLFMSLYMINNISIYRFFYQKKGVIFTIMIIPWLWLYYLYCGVGFIIGLVRYYWKLYTV